MEIYNSSNNKVVDIGISLLSNPQKEKKKKQYFNKQIIPKSQDSTNSNNEKCDYKEELINKIRNYLYNSNDINMQNNSFDKFMMFLIDTQIKLIKYQNIYENIDDVNINDENGLDTLDSIDIIRKDNN